MEPLFVIPYVALLGIGVLAVSMNMRGGAGETQGARGAFFVPLPVGFLVVGCGIAGIGLAIAGLNSGFAGAAVLIGIGGWSVATTVPGRFREAHVARGMRPVPLHIGLLIAAAGIAMLVMTAM